MALTLCIDCCKEISHRALACPRCGCPRPTVAQRRNKKIFITGVVVIFGLMLLHAVPAFLDFIAQFS